MTQRDQGSEYATRADLRRIGASVFGLIAACFMTGQAVAQTVTAPVTAPLTAEPASWTYGPSNTDIARAWLASAELDGAYGPQRIDAEDRRRAGVSLAVVAASRRASLFETGDAVPLAGDRTLAVGGEARIETEEGLAVIPFIGWRLTDIDEEACRSWMPWASFCQDELARFHGRYMLLVDDDMARSAWKTYAGLAFRLPSGLVADVAYKEFDGLNTQSYYTPSRVREDLDETGVVFSLTLPSGF